MVYQKSWLFNGKQPATPERNGPGLESKLNCIAAAHAGAIMDGKQNSKSAAAINPDISSDICDRSQVGLPACEKA